MDKSAIPTFGFNAYGDWWKELFIHPRDAFGVLIQIAEFNADDFLDDSVKVPADRKWEVSHTKTGCRLTIAHPGGGKAALDLNHGEAAALGHELSNQP